MTRADWELLRLRRPELKLKEWDSLPSWIHHEIDVMGKSGLITFAAEAIFLYSNEQEDPFTTLMIVRWSIERDDLRTPLPDYHYRTPPNDTH